MNIYEYKEVYLHLSTVQTQNLMEEINYSKL